MQTVHQSGRFKSNRVSEVQKQRDVRRRKPTSNGNDLAEVVGPSINLYPLLEVLLKVGNLEKTVADRLLRVQGEVRGNDLLGLAGGGLGGNLALGFLHCCSSDEL